MNALPPPFPFLWSNAITVVPLVLLAALAARWLPARPATRHALWLAVLCWFVSPPLAWLAPRWIADRAATPAPAAAAPSVRERAAGKARPQRLAARPAQSAARPEPRAALRSGRTESSDAATTFLAADPPRAYHPADERPPRAHYGEPPFLSIAPTVSRPSAPRSEPAAPRRPSEQPGAQDSRIGSRPPAAAPPAAAARWLQPALDQATIVFATLRASVARLPVLPAPLWLGGMVLIAVVHLFGAWRLRRRLRHTVEPPAWVRRMVADAAAAYGLRRAPATLFVDANISPMVWCGWRPRVLLPVRLWQQLDQRGRRAVLFHELAHIRRRDHWVRWLELLVCAMFWWHPLAWWTRRRLTDESESCCDSWVTWLFPQSRRAYAEALLAANHYTQRAVSRGPGLGVEMAASSARRFARRITMIMTQSNRPGLSPAGALLAAALLGAGWLVSPAVANLPSNAPTMQPAAREASAKSAPARATPARAPVPLTAVSPRTPAVVAIPGVAAAPAGAGSPTVIFLNPDGSSAVAAQTADERRRTPSPPRGAADRDDLRQRLRELEEELRRLSELLDDRDDRGPMPRARGPRAPAPPVPPTPPVPSAPPTPPAPPAPPALMPQLGGVRGQAHDGRYHLSEGKLEALYELLVRDDVPVPVRRDGDALEVHAGPREQEIVGRFIAMIEPETLARSYRLDPAKLELLWQLLSRNDVPLFVSRDGDAITVHATREQHQAFEAFIRLIGGSPAGRTESDDAADAFGVGGGASSALAREHLLHALTEPRRDEKAAKALAMYQQAAAVGAKKRVVEAQARALEQQAEALARQSERLMQRREALEREGEELRASAGSAEPARRAEKLARAEALAKLAREIEQQCAELERHAEELEAQADRLDEELGALDEDVDFEFDSDWDFDGDRESEFEALDLAETDADEAPPAPECDAPQPEVP